MPVRGSSERGTMARGIFVAALIVVGLIASCLVIFRVDPRPANFRHGSQVTTRSQSGSEASRR